MNIGTADVDLDPPHLLLFIQQPAGLGIILHAEAADVRHHFLMEDFLQLRQFLRDDFIHPGILQAHGIDHTCRVFVYSIHI